MRSLRKKILSASRISKKFITATSDFLLLLIASIFAISLSYQSIFIPTIFELFILSLSPLLSVVVLYLSGIYRSVLRYIDFTFFYKLFFSISFVFLIDLSSAIYVDNSSKENIFYDQMSNIQISTAGWIVELLSSIILLTLSRIMASRLLIEGEGKKKVVIYGAGSAGIQLAGALKVSQEMQPVAFLDEDENLQGTFLGGIKVLGPTKLKRLVFKNRVEEVLIAMPSLSRSKLKSILKQIEDYSIKVRILPGLAELAQGKVLVSELKEVDICDLLGRQEVEANLDLISKNIKDKVVLITGAGGSIGSEISRQVTKYHARRIILLDSNEFSLYEIKKEIESLTHSTEVDSILANVTNSRRMIEVCQVFDVDTIYHAAAYKHVPLVEENPFEGVSNNIFGTKSCIEAAVETNVETFVLISTDKAVRPTNIMGATKRFSEMILQVYAEDVLLNKSTRITMVRFGNVIGSSGSAIPLFQQQIRDGGPVTVTDSEVTRYFMSIPEAAELVIQAGAMGEGGDVFVLDMGEPVNIFDLAKRLIKLSGMELKDDKNPEGDIEIIFTGLRPGEKLYEELLIGNNVSKTQHNHIFRAEEECLSKEELNNYLKLLRRAEAERDVLGLKELFMEVIHGFQPEEETFDTIYLRRNSKEI